MKNTHQKPKQLQFNMQMIFFCLLSAFMQCNGEQRTIKIKSQKKDNRRTLCIFEKIVIKSAFVTTLPVLMLHGIIIEMIKTT